MIDFIKNVFRKSDDNLKSLIQNGAFLVDVRTPAEFASGSASGAVNIPLDNLLQQISQFKDKNNIVVFFRSGNRSGMAKKILENQGFKNVTNGDAWQNVASLTK